MQGGKAEAPLQAKYLELITLDGVGEDRAALQEEVACLALAQRGPFWLLSGGDFPVKIWLGERQKKNPWLVS